MEPIYLKSDTESNFPEMKMVVVSFGERIVMEPTLEQAIERIFGIYTEPEQPVEQEYDNTNINDLIKQATDLFNEATEASQKGNWAAYGESLKELEDILNQLNLLTNGAVQNTGTENNTENNMTNENTTEEQQNQ